MTGFYGDGVARFESTVQQELKRVVTELEEKVGQDVVLKDVLGHSIINIMVILVTGKSSDTYPDLNKAIADYDNKLTNLLTMRFVIYMKLFPFLVYVPGTWFKRVWDAAVVSKKRLLKLAFEDMKASWVPGQPRGMTDIFFDEQRKEGRDWLTDEYVKGLVLDLLFAGTSTTLETLSSMFLFFLHHPDVVKNIQAEVDRVVGSREPRLEDRPRCSYTEAAILESMRFLTLLPLGVSHKARDEVQFRGFTIPKGTLIFSVSWAMNNSADVWGDPGTFRPERFLDDKGNLLEATHPVRQQHLNFGVGKRACPGEVFARARIFLYVTTLLQRFDILPPQTESLLPLDKDSWHMGGFRVVKKYRCIFRKRSLSE
nr:hypothetical protein BaRGS_019729 [Batillaria attramentaria]